jgi:hypothetical protein
MRVLAVLLVSSMLIGSAASVHAECYGDAANMYGCNNGAQSSPSRGAGELERFGGESEQVLPHTGSSSSGRMTTDDLFTHEEQRRMLKNIVTSDGNSYSKGAFVRSMHAGSRPIRRYGTRGTTIRTR